MQKKTLLDKLEFACTILRVQGCLSDTEAVKVRRRIAKKAKSLGYTVIPGYLRK